MKVLITGAAGFLGQRVARDLAADHDVTGTDLHPRPGQHSLDVTNLDAVRAAVRGHDAVVHCVAMVRGRAKAPLRQVAEINVIGTWVVAEAMAQEAVGTLVYISSIAADGMAPSGAVQHQVGNGLNFAPGDHLYAISKHLGEAIANAYASAFRLRVLNLRPGILSGDGENPDPARPANAPPYWFAHVDPDDVATAVALALASDAAGTYSLLAARNDSLWDWRPAAAAFGYDPRNKWSGV